MLPLNDDDDEEEEEESQEVVVVAFSVYFSRIVPVLSLFQRLRFPSPSSSSSPRVINSLSFGSWYRDTQRVQCCPGFGCSASVPRCLQSRGRQRRWRFITIFYSLFVCLIGGLLSSSSSSSSCSAGQRSARCGFVKERSRIMSSRGQLFVSSERLFLDCHYVNVGN